ncbi:hypothetical protein Tcan_00479, partial [Toxocara canis]
MASFDSQKSVNVDVSSTKGVTFVMVEWDEHNDRAMSVKLCRHCHLWLPAYRPLSNFTRARIDHHIDDRLCHCLSLYSTHSRCAQQCCRLCSLLRIIYEKL